MKTYLTAAHDSPDADAVVDALILAEDSEALAACGLYEHRTEVGWAPSGYGAWSLVEEDPPVYFRPLVGTQRDRLDRLVRSSIEKFTHSRGLM